MLNIYNRKWGKKLRTYSTNLKRKDKSVNLARKKSETEKIQYSEVN